MKILFLLVCVVGIAGGNKKCISRDYGNGGSVCVCNEDYCDIADPEPTLSQGQYVNYVSSMDGLRLETSSGSFHSGETSNRFMKVDRATKYQSILGWGACFTDSSWYSINRLSTKAQELFWKSYFGQDGADYNLCRVPIGGTDYSNRPYTLDDMPDGQIDIELKSFNLTTEDYLYKIPTMKKALRLSTSNLKFYASAWSAPNWMKMNNRVSGLGSFIRPVYYQSWSDYHFKFLQAYEASGLTFWGITTGNEPVNGLVPSPINSNAWTPFSQSSWIAEYLGPSIRNSKYSNLKILGLDDQRFFLPWWMDIVYSSKAGKYVDGTSIHWYFNFASPSFLQTWLHNNHPDKLILSGEASILFALPIGVQLGAWYRGEQYAEDIIDSLLNWGQGWLDWNFAVNLKGGPAYTGGVVDGSIVVNITSGEFYKQPMYYVMHHFSKFIPEGSVRIGLTGTSDLYSVALERPDGRIVIVTLNKSDQEKTVQIVDNTRGMVDNLVPKRSISTFIYY